MHGIQPFYGLGLHHDRIVYQQIDLVGIRDQEPLEADIQDHFHLEGWEWDSSSGA
jgi:hypothetical protein